MFLCSSLVESQYHIFEACEGSSYVTPQADSALDSMARCSLKAHKQWMAEEIDPEILIFYSDNRVGRPMAKAFCDANKEEGYKHFYYIFNDAFSRTFGGADSSAGTEIAKACNQAVAVCPGRYRGLQSCWWSVITSSYLSTYASLLSNPDNLPYLNKPETKQREAKTISSHEPPAQSIHALHPRIYSPKDLFRVLSFNMPLACDIEPVLSCANRVSLNRVPYMFTDICLTPSTTETVY